MLVYVLCMMALLIAVTQGSGCSSTTAVGWPQTCTLQQSIPSIVEANFSQPAVIQCRTTCQTEILCLPKLRLYIPNGAFLTDLALDEISSSATLFSHETVTGIEEESNGTNATCVAFAEFRILPKSYDLHDSLAMCGVSCPIDSSNMSTIYFFEAAFVIKLQLPQPTSTSPTVHPQAQLSPEIIAPVTVILFTIIMVLLVLLLVISFLYMRSRKRLAPFIDRKSADKLTSVPLMHVMEVNEVDGYESENKRELRVRQETVRGNEAISKVNAEDGTDHKLPDFISSRERNSH